MKFLFNKISNLIRNNIRGIKAVYYKKAVLSVRLSDVLPLNYGIAKKIYEGYFGNATYTCDELMICYKNVSEKMNGMEYEKVSYALYIIGFNLYYIQKRDGYVVALMPDVNVLKYITDRTLKLGKFNIEDLRHLT